MSVNHNSRPASRPTARDDTPAIPLNDIRFGANIADTLYADIAEAKARFIANYSSSKEANKPTQLRRFYDELCMWNEKVNQTGTTAEREARYKELAPLIKMLKAKVAYAEGRKHVDRNFQSLFAHGINEIKDAGTLAQCKLFFEAFMGFYKAVRPN